ncbi:MAG: serine/threonine protein kinase [Planctomycetes bacterium]|nr:serine/threonine protein kinase [Planctomycetota bacterium]
MTQSSNVDKSDRARPDKLPVFGRWKTVGELHSGNLMRVFLARPLGCPKNWPSDYVVKSVTPNSGEDSIALDLLRREAQVGLSVKHSHLISMLSAQVDEPPYYLVMPFLPGQPLARRISREIPVRLPFSLWVMRQVAEGLEALHAQGWMHGDVKPSNIMIAPQGHATLIDFGFAFRERERYGNQDPLLTTPHYTAPERLTGANSTGYSDIYSLGAVLYELLTGRLPFEATEPYELAVAHLQQKPPEPRRFNTHLPPRVVRLLRRMSRRVLARRQTRIFGTQRIR